MGPLGLWHVISSYFFFLSPPLSRRCRKTLWPIGGSNEKQIFGETILSCRMCGRAGLILFFSALGRVILPLTLLLLLLLLAFYKSCLITLISLVLLHTHVKGALPGRNNLPLALPCYSYINLYRFPSKLHCTQNILPPPPPLFLPLLRTRAIKI